MSTGKIVGLSILGLVIIVGVPLLIWFIRYQTADTVGAINQHIQTKTDVQYRIASYDHFFNQCSEIQATEDQIRNAQEQAKSDPTDERFSAAVLALKNQRAELVRTYNTDTHKKNTIGDFKASELPWVIDISSLHTVCDLSATN